MEPWFVFSDDLHKKWVECIGTYRYAPGGAKAIATAARRAIDALSEAVDAKERPRLDAYLEAAWDDALVRSITEEKKRLSPLQLMTLADRALLTTLDRDRREFIHSWPESQAGKRANYDRYRPQTRLAPCYAPRLTPVEALFGPGNVVRTVDPARCVLDEKRLNWWLHFLVAGRSHTFDAVSDALLKALAQVYTDDTKSPPDGARLSETCQPAISTVGDADMYRELCKPLHRPSDPKVLQVFEPDSHLKSHWKAAFEYMCPQPPAHPETTLRLAYAVLQRAVAADLESPLRVCADMTTMLYDRSDPENLVPWVGDVFTVKSAVVAMDAAFLVASSRIGGDEDDGEGDEEMPQATAPEAKKPAVSVFARALDDRTLTDARLPEFKSAKALLELAADRKVALQARREMGRLIASKAPDLALSASDAQAHAAFYALCQRFPKAALGPWSWTQVAGAMGELERELGAREFWKS